MASVEPTTKEILDILEKSSVIDVDSDLSVSSHCGISDIELEEEEEDEGESEVVEEDNETSFSLDEDLEGASMSSLVRICLHNISSQVNFRFADR